MQIFYMIYGEYSSPISISKDISMSYDRFNNMSKLDIIKSCWLSLQDGLTVADTIHLLAVKVDEDLLAWLKSTCKASIIVKDMPAMAEHTPPYGEHPYKEYHEVRVNHFIPQYKYIFEIIEQNQTDDYYVCLDDYLHRPNSINNIKEFLRTHQDFFLVPYEYSDFYFSEHRFTEMFISNQGYFRKTNSATPTIAANGKVWMYFKYYILRASVFADDSWTHRAFNIVKALTPLPAWSTHLQNGCLSPFIDWAQVSNHYLKNK